MIVPTQTTTNPSALPAPHFTSRVLLFGIEGQAPTITYEAKFVLDVYRTQNKPQPFAIRAHTTKQENGRAWEVKGQWCYFYEWAEVTAVSRTALESLRTRIVERLVTAAYEQEAMSEFRDAVATAYYAQGQSAK